MKDIVILGSARAGKTTLARKINKIYPNYHIINGDCIRQAFQTALPQTKIGMREWEGKKEDFAKFTATFFKEEIKWNKGHYNYIFENCDISAENAIKYFQDESTIILFLGYSNLNKEKVFNNWKKYDTPEDWTYKKTDDELLKYAEQYVKDSKEFQTECEKYHIKYVDTSYNREKILKELLEEIINIIK